MRIHLTIILVFALFLYSVAQDKPGKTELIISVETPGKNVKIDRLTLRDSSLICNYIKEIISDYHDNGYLYAYDSVINTGNPYRVNIKTGDRIKVTHDSVFVDNNGSKTLFSVIHNGKYYSHHKNLIEREKLLLPFENNGYPFVRTQADSMHGDSQMISFRYIIQRGPYIINDSLTVHGNRILKPKFLFRYLQIVPGRPYNNKVYIQAEKKLKQLGFISVSRPPDTWFGSDKAKLNVYLKKNNANRFQGIAGIVPPSGNETRTTITGDVSLFLVNTFKNADNISLDWKKYDRYGQQLEAKFCYPYLFYLPTGIDLKFDLVKKDSSYINTSFNWNIPYFFNGNNQAGLVLEKKTSNVLTNIATSGLTSFERTSAGMFLKWNNFDRAVIPRKGAGIEVTFLTGKKVSNNSNDSIAPTVTDDFFEQQSAITFCHPFSSLLCLKVDARSGFLSGSDIFINEQWRLGGFKSLRGFDEESIYAQKYISGNIEIKAFFGEYSNVFAFYNIAGYIRACPENISDMPYGFGWGVELETPAGILSLVYALGKQFDNPVELRNSKVHISLLNRF